MEVAAGDVGAAQLAAREAIARLRPRCVDTASNPDAQPKHTVVVRLGEGVHRVPPGGLVLGPRDSGEAGCVAVRWQGAPPRAPRPAGPPGTVPNGTVVDGGVSVPPATWSRVEGAAGVWQAALPLPLPSARQLYVDGLRYNRTRQTAVDAGLDPSAPSISLTPDGWATASRAPMAWADPASVEMVFDDTWIQTRCGVRSVSLSASPPAEHRPATNSCVWSPRLPGTSPGSSLMEVKNVSTWSACTALCCAAAARGCKAVVWHDLADASTCFLLDRTYGANYKNARGAFVANLNAPPPSRAPTLVNMTQPCLSMARVSGYGQVNFATFFENTGNLTEPGQFWIDRARQRVLVRAAGGPAQNMSASEVVLAAHEGPLLTLQGAHDLDIVNVSFVHSTWNQPTEPTGFVERYSNVRWLRRGGSGSGSGGSALRAAPGAVMVANSTRITLSGCSLARLGQWGMRIFNASQNVTVSRCAFDDLSGGAVAVGNENDTAEVLPSRQTARIVVQDNTMTRIGREFRGAAALHSFCMRDSVWEHNAIHDVGYTGLSFNWPSPQGPTLGARGTSNATALGYSARNSVHANLVTGFMGYMVDGGGIHTIGRSWNSSISNNVFADIAAGSPGRHSPNAQSVIYVDNWSCELSILDNVLDNVNATIQGPWFFQGSHLGPAHDTRVEGLWLRNAGAWRGRGGQCNCSQVERVPSGGAWPPAAAAIVAAAGPRPRG